jgi:Iap family predicted aminopeptidase
MDVHKTGSTRPGEESISKKPIRNEQTHDQNRCPATGHPVHDHLAALCTDIGERPTGSAGSRRAEEYIREKLEALEYQVESQEFLTRNWTVEEATCRCGEETVPVVANPYSPGCSTTAPVVWVGSINDLKHTDLVGKIVIAHGDLTAEPLMPKNFRFYRHEPHLEIIRILEEKEPAALITVSPRLDYAIPVIIDGDFQIPSCTVTSSAGDHLRTHPDDPVTLIIKTRTSPTRAANVIGRQGTRKRIVLCAHLDTKHYTPGALDNASGVAALLLLARRFVERSLATGLEFVFFNGEECYHVPGEGAYLDAGYPDTGKVVLAINIDGIGLPDHRSGISYYGCPDGMVATAERARESFPDLERAEPWPQGDHMIFQGIPAMAVSAHAAFRVIEKVIHTPADTQDRLDEALIERTVDAVEAIVRALDREGVIL